uniref:Uncharacterized protein n=1 Tax=Timema douglasi TaxID=61478 RepID=A0A7R8VVU0_TIMDO|nr:unnamed protein product [Timema douglasi]
MSNVFISAKFLILIRRLTIWGRWCGVTFHCNISSGDGSSEGSDKAYKVQVVRERQKNDPRHITVQIFGQGGQHGVVLSEFPPFLSSQELWTYVSISQDNQCIHQTLSLAHRQGMRHQQSLRQLTPSPPFNGQTSSDKAWLRFGVGPLPEPSFVKESLLTVKTDLPVDGEHPLVDLLEPLGQPDTDEDEEQVGVVPHEGGELAADEDDRSYPAPVLYRREDEPVRVAAVHPQEVVGFGVVGVPQGADGTPALPGGEDLWDVGQHAQDVLHWKGTTLCVYSMMTAVTTLKRTTSLGQLHLHKILSISDQEERRRGHFLASFRNR